jgi:hypothetical protein
MRPNKLTVYEWFIVVEGAGDFPFDMLRYDACIPLREQDARAMERGERRRIVLVRRGVNQEAGTPARWASFKWDLQLATAREHEAIALGDAPPGTFPRSTF